MGTVDRYGMYIRGGKEEVTGWDTVSLSRGRVRLITSENVDGVVKPVRL